METIKKRFAGLLQNKHIAILGFGREGQSSLHWLHRLLPQNTFAVCDVNADAVGTDGQSAYPASVKWFMGPDYLEGLSGTDLIIRSPGIPFTVFDNHPVNAPVTSQTEMFLRLFRDQVTGITGTKGKSTTASLLYHVLRASGQKTVLAGNIGIPCFDLLEAIDAETHIVFEMSSHQLQEISVSPHVAVLLNLFREHLDHYGTFDAYMQAKMNIARWQEMGDYFMYNAADQLVRTLSSSPRLPGKRIALGGAVSSSGMHAYCRGGDFVVALEGEHLVLRGIANRLQLPGRHNVWNALAAAAIALLHNVPVSVLDDAMASFRGLPHRLEYVGTFRGARFYDDSIATVPEATVAALRSMPDTHTLILGGKDRGGDYRSLMKFIAGTGVEHVLLTGDAGKKMASAGEKTSNLRPGQLEWFDRFDDAVRFAFHHTAKGRICLLSPAAASYDAFRNFEEKGRRFRHLLDELST